MLCRPSLCLQAKTLVLPPLIHGFHHPHPNACVTACGKTLMEAIKTVLMLISNDVFLVWCGSQWIIMVSEAKLCNCIQSLGIGLYWAIYTGLNKVFSSQCPRFFYCFQNHSWALRERDLSIIDSLRSLISDPLAEFKAYISFFAKFNSSGNHKQDVRVSIA